MKTKKAFNTNLVGVVIITMVLLISATVFASQSEPKVKVKHVLLDFFYLNSFL